MCELDEQVNRDLSRQKMAYLLADAAMPTCSKRLVRTPSPLTHGPEAIVNLLSVIARPPGGDAIRVHPTRRLPLIGGEPYLGIHLGDERGRHHQIALRDYKRCPDVGERAWNDDVFLCHAHHGVDGRVSTKRFAYDGVENRKHANVIVSQGAEGAVVIAEVLQLLLVYRRADGIP
jgi:hypothetical protein